MIKIFGKFTKIVFASPTKDFFVVNFKLDSNQDEIKQELGLSNKTNNITVIIKDNIFELKASYEIYLTIQESKKYGQNFIVNKKILIAKENRESIILFLSSKLFPRISTKTATKIVDKFGENFLKDYLKYKIELIELIGKNKANSLIENLANQKDYENVYRTFLEKELSISILSIIENFVPKTQLLNYLTNQIFSLVYEVENIDFIELDKIAKVYLQNYSDEERIKYRILWIIKKIEFYGSTIIEIKDIFYELFKYELINKEQLFEYLKSLINESKIILDYSKTKVSLVSTYKKELYICERMKEFMNKFENIDFAKVIVDNLDNHQQKALFNALSSSISIITGAPGTGKTKIIKTIIDNLNQNQKNNFELLTPTGKSAIQITSKSKIAARTIHSFLRYNKIGFDINEKNPSSVEVLIIDEFSMVNIDLFYSLLKGSPNLKKIILIGDHDQLPSIGAGYLLNDFIFSNKFKVTKLKKIYRQKQESYIIKNALLINHSMFPKLNESDTNFISASGEELLECIKNYVTSYIDFNKDLTNQQILIPTYKTYCGIDEINKLVQNIVNKNKNEIFTIGKNKKFFFNDKVIHLENDLEKNVFNGEIGYIKNVLFNKNRNVEKIIVSYDGKDINYTISEFNENVSLAYAISVHKFQGSECDEILLIMSSQHKSLLSKKLFYTAYTRAIKKVLIIGEEKAIEFAINNDFDSKRKCNILNLLN